MKTTNKGENLKIQINDFDLSYDDLGEGTIPIIFIHGFPFDKTMWKKQLNSLKATNRVIAYDIRGFGQSTDEKKSLSIDLFAEDLIAFMDKLGIDKAILCGLSMGGYITLRAQQKFPNRFEALILCDTQCIADSKEAKQKRYTTIEEIEKNGTDDFNEGFIKNVFHSDSLTNKKTLVEEVKKVVDANSKNSIQKGLIAIAERSETCSSLTEINIPTLIICGREDKVTPLEQSEFMHENITNSVLQIIEKAGHVSNLEHPEEFNQYIIDFLSTLKK